MDPQSAQQPNPTPPPSQPMVSQTPSAPTGTPQGTTLNPPPAPPKSKKILMITIAIIVFIVLLFLISSLFGNKTKTASIAPLPTVVQSNQTTIQPTVIPTVAPKEASISLSPNPLNLAGTKQGSIDVVLDTATQHATAAQIQVSYDPKTITVTDIKPGTFFDNPTVLIKKINQTAGTISYAIGIGPTGQQKQGSGTIAIINFTVVPSGTTTKIDFLPQTIVTQQGTDTSILKSSIGTTINF